MAGFSENLKFTHPISNFGSISISDFLKNFPSGEFDYSDAAQSANETVKDERIHLLVYFVAPGAYGLTHTDIATLKTLDNVNKLIVIAKADSMTPKELDSLRAKVAKQMKAEQISSSIVISDKEYFFLAWLSFLQIFGTPSNLFLKA